MNPSAVLAAAAAMHEFTLGQVAAYCNGDRGEVQEILDISSQFFTPVGGPPDERRWRVSDAAALRAAIARESPAGTRSAALSPRRAQKADALEARLLLAEETLVDCGVEPSPAGRQIMAATVMNYLQQVVAARIPGHVEWWEIEAGGLPGVALSTDGARMSVPRIRTDVALARMTACEAAGETMAVEYLIDTAIETRRLVASGEVDRQRFSKLLGRLWNLSRDLTTPARHGSATEACTVAPARLLSAVAWRRACVRAEDDGPAVARELVDLLKGMARAPLKVSQNNRMPLYQVLGSLPHGRQRIAVYSDLLHLLPRHFRVALKDQILPGAVVEAVAETAASHHLRGYASAIETDLVGSPYRSDSALIGQVVHVFQDLAAREARVDGSVVERGERTRAELLTLAGVPV
jgi:hypothetical protein